MLRSIKKNRFRSWILFLIVVIVTQWGVASGTIFASDEPGDEVYGFGANNYGQLGLPAGGDLYTPQMISTLIGKNIVSISGGQGHTLALTADGQVYAFGSNSSGQLGLGNKTSMDFPTHVPIGDETDKAVAVAAGPSNSLVLTASGVVYAFGAYFGPLGRPNPDGIDFKTPVPIDLAEKVIGMDLGRFHALLVTEGGNAYSFGSSMDGALCSGSIADQAKPYKIVAGLPLGVRAKAVAAGINHSLILLEDGTVYGCGRGDHGELGDGDDGWEVLPKKTALPSDQKAVAISAGDEFSLVLTQEGRVYAFGEGGRGQLGLGADHPSNQFTPERIDQAGLHNERVVEISAGGTFSLLRTETGKAYSFGNNKYIGQGDSGADAFEPADITPAGATVRAVAAGRVHGFLLARGTSAAEFPGAPTGVTAVASDGQVVIGFVPPVHDGGSAIVKYAVYLRLEGVLQTRKEGSTSPIVLDNLYNGMEYSVTVTAFNAKGESPHSTPAVKFTANRAPLDGSGTAAFGDGRYGQLGLGDKSDSKYPVLIPGLEGKRVVDVAAGGNYSTGGSHSLAVTDDGKLYAFGRGEYGQLGTGGTADFLVPTVVPGLAGKRIVAVAAGGEHSLAVADGGELYAFGRNDNGQLGLGDTQSRNVPMQVAALDGSKVVAVAARDAQSLALTTDGKVYAFGAGAVNSKVPLLVTGTWPEHERAVAIAAGLKHALILTASGDVYAFGSNRYGALGIGDASDDFAPTRIEGLPADDKAVAVSAHGYSSLVLTESGAVYAFGDNGIGQLGLGDGVDHYTPVRIAALGGARAIAIASGEAYSFVLTETENGERAVYGMGRSCECLGYGGAPPRPRVLPNPIGALAGKQVAAISASGMHTLAIVRDGTDTIAPELKQAAVGHDNAYVDITFSEGVYASARGVGGLSASAFRLSFAANGGMATGAELVGIGSVTGGTTPDTAGILVGGETKVRVFLQLSGEPPTGKETVRIEPRNGFSVFDADGNRLGAAATTGDVALRDEIAPTVYDVVRNSDTQITVTLSEPAGAASVDKANDGGFTVYETGSADTVVYPVTRIAPGADPRQIVLTVPDTGASGRKGLTVVYSSEADGNGTVVDVSGNKLASNTVGWDTGLWDLTPPAVTSVMRNSDTQLTVSLNEAAAAASISKANDGGFTVYETGSAGAVAYPVLRIAPGADANKVVLTVADFGASGNKGVTVVYKAGGGNGTIADKAGNMLPSYASGFTIAKWDEVAPTLTGAVLAPNNAYIDLTFSEGVYGAVGGATPVSKSSFLLIFSRNGSASASAAEIEAVGKNTAETATEAAALIGGETTVRVYLKFTGVPGGKETIIVKSQSVSSIFDKAGNAALNTLATSTQTLYDISSPKITSVQRAGDIQIKLGLDEPVVILAPHDGDGGFTVEEAGSNGRIVYPVSRVTKGISAQELLLDVPWLAPSGKEGLIVKYARGGNGTWADAAGNLLEETPAQGLKIAAWDTQSPFLIEATMGEDNDYIDITFSEGIYHSNDGTGALTAGDIKLEFRQNEYGKATALEVTGIQTIGGQPLKGGETTVRVMVAVTGTPNGHETIVLPAVGSSFYDAAGNAFDPFDPYFYPTEVWLQKKLFSKLEQAVRYDDSTIEVKFSEPMWYESMGSTAGFSVKETGGSGITYEIKSFEFDENTGMEIVLYVAGLGVSAKEGVTVTFKADAENKIYDMFGYEMTESQLLVSPWDEQAPTIVEARLAPDNTYIDITFNEGLYGTANGTGALTANDLFVTFDAGPGGVGGTATGAEIAAVAVPDGATPLSGGETKVRVFLSVSGIASGQETVEIRPKDDGSVFDRAGNAMAFTQTSGAKRLNAAPNVTADDALNRIVGADATMEYSTNGGMSYTTYVPSNPPTFAGNVTVKVRVAADLATGMPAGAVATLTFTTNPPAPGAPNVTADDASNRIVGADATMEYSTDDGANYTTYDTSNPPTFAGNVTVKVRVKADTVKGTPAGAGTTLMFTANPSAPGAPNVTADDASNRIVGADATMEYSTNGGTSYTTYDPSNPPTFAGNVTVKVRVKADAATGTSAGADTTLTFTANPSAPAAPNVTADDALNRIVGADATMEYSTDGGTSYTAYDPLNPPTFTGNVTVKVRVKADAVTGTPAGASTTLTFTANPSAPAAPNVTADDSSNRIVGADATMEYSTDGGTSYTAYDPLNPPTFAGNVTVKVRVKADAVTGTPAGADTTLTFTTNPPAPGAPNVTADDALNRIVGADATMEYSTDGGTSYTAYDPLNPPTFAGNVTVKVRVKADAVTGTPAGASTTLTFTANPSAPAAPNVTADDASNRIVGADATMEYSTDGGTSYTTYDPSNPPTFAGNVTVKVRVKADAATGTPAGADTTLTFTANPLAPAAPSVTADDALNRFVGADATMEYSTDGGTSYTAYDPLNPPTFAGNVTVKVRMKADAVTGTPAGASTTLTFTANPSAPAAPSVTADDALNRIVGADATMEYSTDGGTSYTAYDPSNPPTFTGNVTVKVRVKAGATTGTPAGAGTTLVFTANPPAPAAPSVTADDALNRIVGADATMEYSTDGGTSYTAYEPLNPPTFAGNVTVKVRVKADATTGTPAGADATLTFTTNLSSQNSTISPAMGRFDKYISSIGHVDVTTMLILNGNTMSGIQNGTHTLIEGVDYTVLSNAVTIKKEYLTRQATGTASLTFNFSAGNTQTLTITISDSTPGVLGAPILQSVVAGDAKVSLTWIPAVGSTGYKVFKSVTSGTYGTEVAAVSSSVYSYTVTGLTNGVTYYFVIKATQSGVDSAASNEFSARPFTVPAAPTNVTAAYGNGQATITFTAPTDNGGSAITGYEVTASSGGRSVTGTASPITITGLINGVRYTFTVKAINSAGSSVSSTESNSVVPRSPSGSGGSSTPSEPAATSSTPQSVDTGVNILFNGKTENAGTLSTTKRNDQTVTTIAVDPKKLEEKLAAEGMHAVVTIPVNNKSDIIVGELNGQMIKQMEDRQAVLEIQTDRASYTLPAQQINIDAISGQVGKLVALQDIKVQIEIAAPTADTVKVIENAAEKSSFTLVVPSVDFTLKATYGGAIIEVSKFTAYVERTIAVPDGIDPNKITTGVVVEADGTVRHVPTRVKLIEGKYYAVINSLTNSAYTVVWHPLEFSDMATHWAKEAVNDMGSRMVIDGTGGGQFSPDRDITRAEFAAIIVRGLGLKLENGSPVFSDVKATDWYSGAINTAHAYGLIDGYNDGTFRPNDKITREQAMAIIAKAMKLTGLRDKLAAPSVEETLHTFGDAADVATWAKSGVAYTVQAGIISGRSAGTLATEGYMTRAEVATTIQRLLKQSGLI